MTDTEILWAMGMSIIMYALGHGHEHHYVCPGLHGRSATNKNQV
jgi:hypothetical protein